MGIKDDVERHLHSDSLKKMWIEIYSKFEDGGKEGVKRFLEEKANEIKKEFEKIQEDIQRQIG